LKISYKIQKNPNGLAQAFILGENFIGNDDVCLILGDNILYGQGLTQTLIEAKQIVNNKKKAVIFGYNVPNPKDFGIVEFDDKGNTISIEEKPKKPKSDFAIIGLYFYPNCVIKKSKSIIPSKRGELEISSLNQLYLNEQKLSVKLLRRGFSWFDTGTHDSILRASNFIASMEKNTGLKVACLEEIAMKQEFIKKNQISNSRNYLNQNSYGNYLRKIYE